MDTLATHSLATARATADSGYGRPYYDHQQKRGNKTERMGDTKPPNYDNPGNGSAAQGVNDADRPHVQSSDYILKPKLRNPIARGRN